MRGGVEVEGGNVEVDAKTTGCGRGGGGERMRSSSKHEGIRHTEDISAELGGQPEDPARGGEIGASSGESLGTGWDSN